MMITVRRRTEGVSMGTAPHPPAQDQSAGRFHRGVLQQVYWMHHGGEGCMARVELCISIDVDIERSIDASLEFQTSRMRVPG
eukprot:5989561-Pyramimonas_sp.AAC.1